jgi:hypothetical protein
MCPILSFQSWDPSFTLSTLPRPLVTGQGLDATLCVPRGAQAARSTLELRVVGNGSCDDEAARDRNARALARPDPVTTERSTHVVRRGDYRRAAWSLFPRKPA